MDRVRFVKVESWGPFAGILIVLVVLLIANIHIFEPPKGFGAPAPLKGFPLPRTWPRDYPLYPGVVYQGRNYQQGQVGGQWYDRAWFETRTDAMTVIHWYERRLSAAGYRPVTTLNTGYSRRYGFAIGKRVVDMEIFISVGKPTDISVDFLPPKGKD